MMHSITATKKNNNQWCGPAVISALTGITTGDAATLIRAVGGRSGVRGTYMWEMRAVLEKLGLTVKSKMRAGVISTDCEPPTVREWVCQKRRSEKQLLIITGRRQGNFHFITTQGVRIWDNSNPDGAPFTVYADRKITEQYEITGDVDLTWRDEVCGGRKKAQAYKAGLKRKAKRLAAALNVSLYSDQHGVEVTAPTAHEFLYDGSTYREFRFYAGFSTTEEWEQVVALLEEGIEEVWH